MEEEGGTTSATEHSCVCHVHRIGNLFCQLNTVDKLQFPLPYAQVVKILTILYVFVAPFLMAPASGYATPCIMLFASLGFFGLDEVAEILESPFGVDANDIDMTPLIQELR